jgi:hypothetical protein
MGPYYTRGGHLRVQKGVFLKCKWSMRAGVCTFQGQHQMIALDISVWLHLSVKSANSGTHA